MNRISLWLLDLHMWWLEQRIKSAYRKMTPQQQEKLREVLLSCK